MNPKQISQDDLVLFALQDMTPAEAAEILVHLEHSEAAREELARIQGDLAAYALTSELHSPPALARERLLNRISKEKKIIPMEAAAVGAAEPTLVQGGGGRVIPMENSAARRTRMGFMGWAGWAVAAGCAVAAGLEYHQHQVLQETLYAREIKINEITAESARAEAVMKMLTDGGAMQVALHIPASTGAEPPRPEGHVTYAPSSGKLVFIGLHLAPLEPYKAYELWVIPADGKDSFPAGIFKPDAKGFATVILPQIPAGVTAGQFGVTIENDGGSAHPTLPMVLAGA